jgi:hypothetical protein
MSVTATFSKSSNLPENDVRNKESHVVSEIKRLMDKANEDELNAISEYLQLRMHGIQIIGSATGSIKLLHWCRERSGLERLHEWLVNGRVEDIVKILFNKLLKTTDINRLSVDVTWDENEYKMCLEYFNINAG